MNTLELAHKLYNKAKENYKVCIEPYKNKDIPEKIESMVECILDEYEDTIHNELVNIKQLDSLIADLYSVVNEDLKNNS